MPKHSTSGWEQTDAALASEPTRRVAPKPLDNIQPQGDDLGKTVLRSGNAVPPTQYRDVPNDPYQQAYVPQGYGQQGYPQQYPQGCERQLGYSQGYGQADPAVRGPVLRRPQPQVDPRYARVAPALQESPEQQAYVPGSRAGGSHPMARRAGSAAGALCCRLLAIACRLCALLLSGLVIANAFVTGSSRIFIIDVTNRATSWMPSVLSGVFVYETPFGGNLRGDFVVAAIILFILDWVLVRKARDLRG